MEILIIFKHFIIIDILFHKIKLNFRLKIKMGKKNKKGGAKTVVAESKEEVKKVEETKEEQVAPPQPAPTAE